MLRGTFRQKDGILKHLNTARIVKRPIHNSIPLREDATSLKRILADSIKATGPIPVSRYMSVCTYHPTEGYYSRKDKDPISKQGDFITSPEISQVFGEVGILCP